MIELRRKTETKEGVTCRNFSLVKRYENNHQVNQINA